MQFTLQKSCIWNESLLPQQLQPSEDPKLSSFILNVHFTMKLNHEQRLTTEKTHQTTTIHLQTPAMHQLTLYKYTHTLLSLAVTHQYNRLPSQWQTAHRTQQK